MVELPLFPLDVVLFPGMQLPLRIFEARYKLMINECLEQNKPFGVVLIREGRQAFDPAVEPHTIGCTAHIMNVQRFNQGMMFISTVGRDRFQINALYRDRPYLWAEVEMLPFANTGSEAAIHASLQLRPLVERYLTILQNLGEISFKSSDIPLDPQMLAYLAAIVLKVDNGVKQDLLTAENLIVFLVKLIKSYQLEITLLEKAASLPRDDLPFSIN